MLLTLLPDSIIQIVQITDTHIVPKGQHWYKNPKTKTAERLKKVVKHINNLKPLPNFVIHTGDITESGDIESYKHTQEILSKLKVPYFLVCGNHDNFKNLREVFSSHTYFQDSKNSHYVIDNASMRIIVLDSQVKGKDYGKLDVAALKWLEKTLQESNKDTLIFVHHFPISTREPIFNKINLLNGKVLKKILTQYPNILGLYCGHYHNAAASIFAGKMCWISPSTAPTHILENEKLLGLNLIPPAYSLHTYHNGNITSEIVTVN